MLHPTPLLYRTLGVVVNTASQTGLQAYPNHPLYSSAKWGVVGFTAACGGPWYEQTGVRVNAMYVTAHQVNQISMKLNAIIATCS